MKTVKFLFNLLLIIGGLLYLVSCQKELPISIPTEVLYKGINHQSLGNAKLSIEANLLSVSNIGASGNDGFSIDLPAVSSGDTVEWAITLEDYLRNTRETKEGSNHFAFKDQNGRALMTTDVIKRENQQVIKSDFSPLGVHTVNVELYRGNQRVKVFEEVNISEVTMNGVAEASSGCYCLSTDAIYCQWSASAAMVDLAELGQFENISAVRMIPNQLSREVLTIDGVEVTGKGMKAFQISDASIK